MPIELPSPTCFRAREGAPLAGEATASDLAKLLESAGQEVFDEQHPSAIAQRLANELQPGECAVDHGSR